MSLWPSTSLASTSAPLEPLTHLVVGVAVISSGTLIFGKIWLLTQFITSIIGAVHSPAALSGGHHCQGRQAASALKSMELFSEPADVTGVGAKQDDSPSSLWLYAPGVHYRPKCPKINRKNPYAAAQRSLSLSF